MNKSFILTVLTSSFLITPQFAVAGGSDPFEDDSQSLNASNVVNTCLNDMSDLHKATVVSVVKLFSSTASKESDRKAWGNLLRHFESIPHSHFLDLECSTPWKLVLGLKPEKSNQAGTIKISMCMDGISVEGLSEQSTEESIVGWLETKVFKEPVGD